MNRIYSSKLYFLPSNNEPIRSVVHETMEAVIVAWHVKPGQTIKAHVHPRGQDSWTILSGEGDYQTDSTGSVIRIYAGDIVIAHANQVHGVHNSGQEDLPSYQLLPLPKQLINY